MRQRREGNHKRVCWKVVSYYTDNWSSDLLGTPVDNVGLRVEPANGGKPQGRLHLRFCHCSRAESCFQR